MNALSLDTKFRLSRLAESIAANYRIALWESESIARAVMKKYFGILMLLLVALTSRADGPMNRVASALLAKLAAHAARRTHPRPL